MPKAVLEGKAVAYALLIMQGWEVRDMNLDIRGEYGVNALIRVKKRAWQHVRANGAEVRP
jgi:hypothetical protein